MVLQVSNRLVVTAHGTPRDLDRWQRGEFGLDLTEVNQHGDTVAHLAARLQAGRLNVLKLLSEHNAIACVANRVRNSFVTTSLSVISHNLHEFLFTGW